MILRFIQAVVIWPITCLVFMATWPFIALHKKFNTDRAYVRGFTDGLHDLDFNITQFDSIRHQKAYDEGYKAGSEHRA